MCMCVMYKCVCMVVCVCVCVSVCQSLSFWADVHPSSAMSRALGEGDLLRLAVSLRPPPPPPLAGRPLISSGEAVARAPACPLACTEHASAALREDPLDPITLEGQGNAMQGPRSAWRA